MIWLINTGFDFIYSVPIVIGFNLTDYFITIEYTIASAACIVAPGCVRELQNHEPSHQSI
jgi:hypothetical protein